MTNERRSDTLLAWMLEPARAVRVGVDAIDDAMSRRARRRAVGAPVRARATFRTAA